MKSAELTVSFSLEIGCPYCDIDLDLSIYPYDEDGEYSIPIFNNRWNDLTGKDVECSHCGNSFKISSVEY